jgi:hypothetical protein
MSWPNDVVSEIFKAKLYANEPWRLKLETGGWTFQGENDSHFIRGVDGQWVCDCHTFRRKPAGLASCAHIRAMELMGVTAAAARILSEHSDVTAHNATNMSRMQCVAAAE